MNKSCLKRSYFRKIDLAALALALLSATVGLVILFSKVFYQSPEYAQIRVHTELTDTIALSKVIEPYELTVEGNMPVVLRISAEGVEFMSSECMDKLCIHAGLITSGESAACLPAGVSVTVKGASTDKVDGVVG